MVMVMVMVVRRRGRRHGSRMLVLLRRCLLVVLALLMRPRRFARNFGVAIGNALVAVVTERGPARRRLVIGRGGVRGRALLLTFLDGRRVTRHLFGDNPAKTKHEFSSRETRVVTLHSFLLFEKSREMIFGKYANATLLPIQLALALIPPMKSNRYTNLSPSRPRIE